MKKHKKTRKVLISGLALLLLLVTGCGYSAEEKAAMKQYEKQGKKNAREYIEEKYGFKAKVTDVTCDKVNTGPIPDFWPGPTGNVQVEMEYKGEDFYVYIAGDEETIEGVDDYQMDEIMEDFEDILEDVSGLKAEEMALCYGKFLTMDDKPEGNGMISTYYDGENLDEVLHEQNFRLFCAYIDEDMSDMDEVAEAFGEGCYLFVSYNSEEDYKTCRSESYYNLLGTPIQGDVDKNELFIREYYSLEYDEEEYVVNEVLEHDGFYYTVEDGSEVYFEEAEIDDPDNWNGRGFLGAEQAMEAYSVYTDADKITLYIPVDQIDGDGEYGWGIALQYVADGEKRYKRSLTFDTGEGDYLVTTIRPEGYTDLIFTVLVSTE
ncbi:MAG: hypothetical protein IJ409_10490 [Lachnospiraceae bacterium]|nr:hypothetical protein [Lachnospiraceae bacterium]